MAEKQSYEDKMRDAFRESLGEIDDRRTFPGADRSVRRHCEARDA